MNGQIETYRQIVEDFRVELERISAGQSKRKPADGGWSLQEILGHLIDSAGNFQQRLVRLQSGHLRGLPTYKGSEWVAAQNYNQADWNLLRDLWLSFNLHLLFVMEHMNPESLKNEWFLEDDLSADLEWLIEEYYEHMQNHIASFLRKAEDNPEKMR